MKWVPVIASFAILILLFLLVVAMASMVWIPALAPVTTPLTYYSPCGDSLTNTDCAPADVNALCASGDPRCPAFCQTLMPGMPRLCEYMQACAQSQPDTFAVCFRATCGPDALDGCTPAEAARLCESAVASAPLCADYCDRYYVPSWADDEYPDPVREVCLEKGRSSVKQ